MHETWVGSLRGEDPLEKRTTTHSSILAWRIPWTEEPGRLRSVGFKESHMKERLTVLLYTHTHTHIHIHKEILLNYKKERNLAIYDNMNGLRGYYVKRNKTEKDKHHMISLIQRI